MIETPKQIKREKKEYLRGTLKNMDFLGLVLYYLWIVRLRVDRVTYGSFHWQNNYTLKVQVVNPWNPLSYFFAVGLVIGFLATRNVHIRKEDFKDWADVFKFE